MNGPCEDATDIHQPEVKVTVPEEHTQKHVTSKRHSKYHAIVLVVLCIVLLALSVVFIVLYVDEKEQTHEEERTDYCHSEDCVNIASRMLETMNSSADPCDDFYQYACGGWIQKTKIPAHSVAYGQIQHLAAQNKHRIKNILEDLKEGNGGSDGAVNKAVAYYDSCLKLQTDPDVGEKTMQSFLDGISNLTSWTDVLVKLHNFGVSPLFSIYINSDLRNSTNRIVLLVQSGMVIINDNDNLVTSH